jgi:hypothetical protein
VAPARKTKSYLEFEFDSNNTFARGSRILNTVKGEIRWDFYFGQMRKIRVAVQLQTQDSSD